jgi:N-succinyldiaminopimelate aminotransferase
VVPILADVMPVTRPEAAFYLWLEVPGGDEETFTRDLYAAENVTVLPGRYLSRDHGLSNPGNGRIRVSLVAGLEECKEAARRIARFVASR